jgi:hypothetical protein
MAMPYGWRRPDTLTLLRRFPLLLSFVTLLLTPSLA